MSYPKDERDVDMDVEIDVEIDVGAGEAVSFLRSQK